MTVVPPPDPTEETMIAEIIQALLAALGAAGVGIPAYLQSPQTIVQISGAVAVIVSIVWSFIDRQKTNAALRTARKG